MKIRATVLALPITALALGGCEVAMVANLVSSVLAPTSPRFAPAQSGPFRERTATEDLSPALNEVTGAEITEKCQKNLKKVLGGDENPGPAVETSGEGAALVPDAAAMDGDDWNVASETGACTRKWVCLPALDNPIFTTFCPSPDVVEREMPAENRPRNSEWTWDWN